MNARIDAAPGRLEAVVGLLQVAKLAGEPVKPGPGNAGCGECVNHGGTLYFAPAGKRISRNKVAAVRWEGSCCGRVHGEVEFLLVAFDGQDFAVLERAGPGEVRAAQARWRGLSCAQAIAAAQARLDETARQWEQLPACRVCGRHFVRLFDTIPADVCSPVCARESP